MTTKSSARRESLLAAARKVARDEGLASVTVRSVARESGVSPGSVIYHFSAFEDLVLAAVESVLNQFAEERMRIAEEVTDIRERMATFIAKGIPLEISDELRVIYEAIGFIRERPAFAFAMRSIVDRQVQIYLTTIEIGVRTGEFKPALRPLAIAQHLVALEDAYDMYPIFGMTQGRAQLRENIIALAEVALGTTLPRGPLQD